MNDGRDIIVGIDLGTTNSLIAYADEAGPHLIRDADGRALLPSVVGFDDDGRPARLGYDARDHALERPLTTVYSIKRLMGRGAAEAADETKHLNYRVTAIDRAGGQGRDVAAVAVGSRRYSPPEISAMILAELKRWAEAHFGRAVRKAVITVPAQFDDAQRQATRDAGEIAGWEVVRIVNEPTAAALAYGLDRAEAATVAVYDLGGGTFDISILRMDEGMFEVIATNGDTHLGGDDFDRVLVQAMTSDIASQYDIDVSVPVIRQQIRTLAEQTKMRLSGEAVVPVEIQLGGGRLYRRSFSRSEFEGLIAPLVEQTLDACRRAMRTAGCVPSDIQQVIMVGGSTRIPLVRRRVGEAFECTPYTALDPDSVVALGAAMQAAILSGLRTDMLLVDVTPLALGIETMGGAMGKLIPANAKVPCRATETFTTFQDGQSNVKINVLQGDRELAKDCRSLGVFELTGVPPMPAGIPKIEVTFLIDQNGILNVSAVESRSGQAAGVQIVPSHGLTRAEVRSMQLEAIAHAREDMRAHHLIDVKTTLEFDLHKAEQMLHKYGDLLDGAERASLSESLAALRRFAANCEDPVELNKRREAFNRSTLHLAEIGVREAVKSTAT